MLKDYMAENQKESKAGKYQAYISYSLLLLYFVLSLVIPEHDYITYIFIAIHLIFVGLGILGYVWIQLAIQIAKTINMFTKEMSPQDLTNVSLTNKTALPRFALGIVYWLLPVGAYAYSLFDFRILYIFVWLPIWYPFFYLITLKKIRKFEETIGSPIVKYHNLDDI